ncbi:Uncharacterized protein TCM_017071 [Theobroma cacao]|uniref:Uncharacterized protein n=1 Tax=Theobroma cacao TaxID=3641 RepID=A0A061ECI6_THECC|nr:Uncharacterized protein TCM_017071 [Theobroma cacao]
MLARMPRLSSNGKLGNSKLHQTLQTYIWQCLCDRVAGWLIHLNWWRLESWLVDCACSHGLSILHNSSLSLKCASNIGAYQPEVAS